MHPPLQSELDYAIAAIVSLRREGARVHSLTNTVSQELTANVLLACGASASMTVNPKEVEDFVGHADALHVNLGTLSDERISAIGKAWAVATERKMPIALDPVMGTRSTARKALAFYLADNNPTIVRANQEEAEGLDLLNKNLRCLVVTGATDRVIADDKEFHLKNGHPIMDRVIATGCAQGALLAALATKVRVPRTAALAACMWFGVAGEIAAENSAGPGSFKAKFLDTLYSVRPETILERAIVE